MFSRYESAEQERLEHIDLPKDGHLEEVHELEMLVYSDGVSSLAVVQGSRQARHPKLFVGTGKEEE
ncbi:GTPase HflX, partial [Pseudoalteromonas sp. S1608]